VTRSFDSRESWALDALLDRMAVFPGAPLFALNDWSMRIDVPAGFSVEGRPQLDFRAPIELSPSSETANQSRAWAAVQDKGVARERIRLLDGTDVILCFWDLRSTHGVVMGMLLPPSERDGDDVEDEPEAPLLDRYGTTRRDAVGTVLDADDATCRMLGWTLAELRELVTTELIHPDDHERALTHWLDMLSSPGSPRRWRGRHQRRDGSYCWFEFTDVNLLDDPEHECVTSDFLDISDEMALIESLHERERLLDRLTEALPQGVMQLDRAGVIVHQNARVAELVGRPKSWTFDETFSHVAPADQVPLQLALEDVLAHGVDHDVEVQVAVDGGSARVLQVLLRSTHDDGLVSSVIVSVSDVTERVRLRDELELHARTDALTACLNRRSIMSAIGEMLDDRRPGRATAVVFIDLDGFKSVNDELGHAAGDELLATVASRLKQKVRGDDLVGRLGGDEFLVVLPALADLERACDLADRLAEAVEQPIEIADTVIVPRASYGVACARHDGITVDELVARADRAMYRSKELGRGRPVRPEQS